MISVIAMILTNTKQTVGECALFINKLLVQLAGHATMQHSLVQTDARGVAMQEDGRFRK